MKGINLKTHFQGKMVHLHAFPVRLLSIRSMPIDLISSPSQSSGAEGFMVITVLWVSVEWLPGTLVWV